MTLPLFNGNLEQFGDATALKCDSSSMTYQQLQSAVAERAGVWRKNIACDRPLILLKMANSIDSVVNYLTCLQAQLPAILLNTQARDEVVRDAERQFQPHLSVCEGQVTALSGQAPQIADELALMLPTSGSTGSKKYVALSYTNIQANTRSILSYLPIEPSDVTLGSLPLSYSYGLSVLHTHLAVGACVRLTNHTVMDKGFWRILEDETISSLNGVPSWYEMLLRLRFDLKRSLPALRYLTQAGGKLSESMVVRLAEYAKRQDKQLYIMYGQTEATARIAYLAPEKAISKPSSIGQPINGGRIRLFDAHEKEVTQPGESGELVYQGDNVMLGYVTSTDDLQAFNGSTELKTGDIGYYDDEGDFYITGRIKRIIKLFGERCSLDEVEQQLNSLALDVRCVGIDNKIAVCTCSDDEHAIRQSAQEILNVPPAAVLVHRCKQWPLLENGKIDYRMLEREVFSPSDDAE